MIEIVNSRAPGTLLASMIESDRHWLTQVVDAYRRDARRESLLLALARRCPAPLRRNKLQTVAALSAETRACLQPILERLDALPADERVWFADGQRRAGPLSQRRWIDFVDALLADVAPGIERFERLERGGEIADRPRLARATALQVAIRSFAQLELRGRGRESLRPARALLCVGIESAVDAPLAVAAG